MNKYTIRYQSGEISGQREIYAESENKALDKLWKQFELDNTNLSRAYASATLRNILSF